VRPYPRIQPAVDALESRELLSSLPAFGIRAEIHVGRDTAREGPASGGHSIGTLEGTAAVSFHYGYPIGSSQTLEFSSGTGSVKPFGRVGIVVSGRLASRLDSTAGGLPGTPTPVSLEGSPQGPIVLANARGRRVGEIDVTGGSWQHFRFQVRNLGNHVVSRGTGSLTVPQGHPILGGTESFPPQPTTLNGPVFPFTIML
jgi:hypothetical protein